MCHKNVASGLLARQGLLVGNQKWGFTSQLWPSLTPGQAHILQELHLHDLIRENQGPEPSSLFFLV